ncbi:MAG: hypothetical protein J7496_12025 [Novosphingobium sp.]|nr:hypothetical protein [Novosphingobium sp.]
MPTPLAGVFSGLSLDTNVNTASFDGSVTLGGNVNLTRADLGSRVQVKYVVANGHVQLIRNNSVVADFAPNELSADSNSALALYTRGSVFGTDLPQETFELHVPSIGGVPLTYTRFGTYAKVSVNILNINSSSVNPLIAFVFGQPTSSGSMPHTGSASYTSDVYGAVVVPNGQNTQFYTLGDGHGSATFSANFANSTVSTLISLDSDGGGDFGDLSGTGSIVSSSSAFHGSLTGAGTGEFTGSFFGPVSSGSPAEMGYVFQAQGSGFLAYGNVFGVHASPPPP